MRLSLWQQFSSNHSSHFTVIGEFDSPERAEVVANELRAMLRQIADWYLVEKRSPSDLTPVEVELQQRYDVPWPQPIDWLGWGSTVDQDIKDAVQRFERVISIHHPFETHNTTEPFESLLQKFGANVAGYDIDKLESQTATWLKTHVTCIAPDEAAAQRLVERYSEGGGPHQGKVQHDAQKLILSDMLLNIVRDLPDLLSSLNAEGCQEISYSFEKTAI